MRRLLVSVAMVATLGLGSVGLAAAQADTPAPTRVAAHDCDEPAPVLVPQSFTAVADQATRRITLKWGPVAGATGYRIYEDLYHGSRKLVTTLSGTSSVRGPLEGDFTYAYAVAAVVSGVEHVTEPVRVTLGTPKGDTPPPTTTPMPTPPPTSTPPAPDPSPEPAPLPALFTGDFNTGDWSQWCCMQNKDVNGTSRGYRSYSAQIVNDGPGHETAARFEVRRGDVPDFGGGERSEIRGPDEADVREGDVRVYDFDLKLESGFRPPTDGGYTILMQWHSGNGSPPLHMDVYQNGNIGMWHEWDSPSVIGPGDPGVWHKYRIKVVHSRSNSVGHVQVWRDGVLKVDRKRATMSSSSSYLKTGIYRDYESFAQAVYIDGFRISKP